MALLAVRQQQCRHRQASPVTPAAKTPASPRPPEEAAIDGALETAPTAPGGAGRCRARLFSSLTAGRCHMGGGAIVDGAPGVFAAGGRAVSRPPPERISHGVRQTSAARGGAKERPAPSRPRRVGRRDDATADSRREPQANDDRRPVTHAVAARRQRRVAGTTASRRKPTPHPPTFPGGDVARGAECGVAKGPPLRGLLTGVGMAEIGFLRCARVFFQRPA